MGTPDFPANGAAQSVTLVDDPLARNDEFAVSLNLLRVIRRMSQAELARQSGVTNSAVSAYERSKVDPQTATLRRLFRGLDLPLSVLEETRAFILRIRSQVGAQGSRNLRLEACEPLDGTTVPAEEREIWAEVAILAAEGGRFLARSIRLLFLTLFWLGRAVQRSGPATRSPAPPPANP